MTAERRPAATDPDPFNSQLEPDLVRLAREIEAAYATEPPPHLRQAIGRALDARARERRRPPPRPRHRLPLLWMPRHRRPVPFALVAAALLTLAFAIGGVAAIVPRLATNRAFEMDPGLRHVDQAQLGRSVELAQTVDDVTITVRRVYADANRVVVGYAVTGRDARPVDHFTLVRPTLTTAAGTALPSVGGVGKAGEDGTPGYVEIFDASALAPGVGAEDFRLTIPAVIATRLDNAPPTAAAAREQTVGPWTFRFAVAVLPGRVAEPAQTATAGGVAIRLERVVVTPTETRAYLRFPDTPPLAPGTWQPQLHLAGGDWDSRQGGAEYGVLRPTSGGPYVASFPAALADKRGAWTLTIEALIGVDAGHPADGTAPARLAGPWVFRFVVP